MTKEEFLEQVYQKTVNHILVWEKEVITDKIDRYKTVTSSSHTLYFDWTFHHIYRQQPTIELVSSGDTVLYTVGTQTMEPIVNEINKQTERIKEEKRIQLLRDIEL